jgi:hypothetical protein
MESGMDGAGALKLATTMSAVSGALVGGPDSAAAVNVASQMGANAAANNALTGKQQQAKDLLKQQAKNPQDIAKIDAAFKELDAVQTKALVSATNAKDAYALATTAQEKLQAYEQLKSAYSDLGDMASALTKQGDGAGAAVYGKAALTTYLTLQVAANEAGQPATPLTPAQRDLVTKQFIELGIALDSSDSAVARSALQKLNSASSSAVAKVGGSGVNGGTVDDETAALGRIGGNANGPVLNEKPSNTVLNQQAVNDLLDGSLPGITKNPKTGMPDVIPRTGVPREMPGSINPSATAEDFASRLFGRTSPPANAEPIANCPGCWKAQTTDGTFVIYRPASTASGKTSQTTASVDINIGSGGNALNNGSVLKLKFPKAGGQQ